MEKLPAPSRTQPTDSSPNLSLEAAKCAKLILGSYRTGDANDPDTYVRVIAAVLTCYPVEIMKEVSDPRWGIATKIKWLPTLYDVKEACEAAMQPVYRREREAAHAAERRQRLSAPNIPRPTLKELQAKYGENWGLHPEASGKTKWEPKPLDELLKEAGMSKEDFEAANNLAVKSRDEFNASYRARSK